MTMTTTLTIKTDESHVFRVRPIGGGEHDLQRIPPEGGVVAVAARTVPGGPRGTSSPEVLPAGARVRRIRAGDEHTCAVWQVEVDDAGAAS
jgi:hypothetical protein